MPSRLENLYREAVRRRLVQTAALYIAIAWGGTEILVFLAQGLFGESATVAARRYLAILLIAGFPAAMYLAWTRDLGLKARRLVSAGVVVLLAIAVLIAIVPPEPPPPDGESVRENTLAVIPFEVCQDRTSDLPLAGGLTIEVHKRLQPRDHIQVRGLESSRVVMKSKPSDTLAADLLDVRYLLKGHVCRDGLNLTLHTELVDDRGFVVWEENYTQGVNQADQIRERLAKLVDNGVAGELGDVIVASGDFAVSRRAHEQLLIGHGYLDNGDEEKAREAYWRALEHQPDYAEAVYALGRIEDDRGERRPIMDRALDLARAALERNPHDYTASVTAAKIEFSLGRLEDAGYKDIEDIGEDEVLATQAQAKVHYLESERLARAALVANPADTDVRIGLVHAIDLQGADRRRESLELLEQGLDNEPFNAEFTALTAYRLAEFGRLREAMEIIDRFNALPQGKKTLWWDQLEILQNYGWWVHGRTEEKLAYLLDLMKTDPEYLGGNPVLAHLWWNVADIAWLGLFEEAADVHAIVERIPNPEDTPWWRWAREFFLIGKYVGATGHWDVRSDEKRNECASKTNKEILDQWHLLAIQCAGLFWEAGDNERARTLLEALQHERWWSSIWAEREVSYAMILARLYLDMGMEKYAEDAFRSIADQLEPQFETGVRQPHTLGQLAEARYRTGEIEGALEMLHLAIDYGAYDMLFCCEDYVAESNKVGQQGFWANELTGNPDAELARSRMRAIVEQQRSNILALLEQNDMDMLLAPLISPSPTEN